MGTFLLSIYQPDGGTLDPEALDAVMSEMEALNQEMRRAGVWVFAAGLQPPSTATVLREYNGEVTATDGPYAEAMEHIGGFTVISAADEEDALGWGRRMAAIVKIPVEVRPVATERGDSRGHQADS